MPADTPKVRYYTMGANEWQTSSSWPPAGAEMVTWYLDSDGAANSLFGDGRLVAAPPETDAPDRFTYDPSVPVPSLGGGVCCTGGAVEAGSFDQRGNEARHDVLVYTSEPLAEPVEVSGTIDVTLYVASDAKDTDFTVKLVDVYPDGTAYNLDETIQRARYRDGLRPAGLHGAGRGLRARGQPDVDQQPGSAPGTASGSRSRAATSRASPATSTPAATTGTRPRASWRATSCITR